MDLKLAVRMFPNIIFIAFGVAIWLGIPLPGEAFMAGLGCVGCGVWMTLYDLGKWVEANEFRDLD